jgi:hypothetical protein
MTQYYEGDEEEVGPEWVERDDDAVPVTRGEMRQIIALFTSEDDDDSHVTRAEMQEAIEGISKHIWRSRVDWSRQDIEAMVKKAVRRALSPLGGRDPDEILNPKMRPSKDMPPTAL